MALSGSNSGKEEITRSSGTEKSFLPSGGKNIPTSFQFKWSHETKPGLQILSLKVFRVYINILSGFCFSNQLKPKELSSKVLGWLKSFKTSDGEVFGGFIYVLLFTSQSAKIESPNTASEFYKYRQDWYILLLFREYVAKSQYIDELSCRIHLVRRPIAHLFWEIILRYLSMVLSWVLCSFVFFRSFAKW